MQNVAVVLPDQVGDITQSKADADGWSRWPQVKRPRIRRTVSPGTTSRRSSPRRAAAGARQPDGPDAAGVAGAEALRDAAGRAALRPAAAAAATAKGRGARSALIRGLRGLPPFDGTQFVRLPWGGTAVADADIDRIETWIDEGCPAR